MKRIILMTVFAGLMAPVGLYAQRVYKDDLNRVVLDLSVDAGMPANAVTKESKTTQYASIEPSSSNFIANNTINASINKTVYHKLEIAPHDLSGNNAIGPSRDKFKWVTAFNSCKNLDYGGGRGWRLPTQREQALIYVFKLALESVLEDNAVNGTKFFTSSILDSGGYWSATEKDSNISWFLYFEKGNSILGGGKSLSFYARCVREL